MSHDIGHQIARFIAQHHTNDINFFKKLYCDSVFREITNYKEKIHKNIIEKKTYIHINNTHLLYLWNQTENTRLWVDLNTGTILEHYINNSETYNPNIIPLYFINEFDKKALIQLTKELDLKIKQCGVSYNTYYILSWEHWKFE